MLLYSTKITACFSGSLEPWIKIKRCKSSNLESLIFINCVFYFKQRWLALVDKRLYNSEFCHFIVQHFIYSRPTTVPVYGSTFTSVRVNRSIKYWNRFSAFYDWINANVGSTLPHTFNNVRFISFKNVTKFINLVFMVHLFLCFLIKQFMFFLINHTECAQERETILLLYY